MYKSNNNIRTNGKVLSARLLHALKSKVKISSNKKYWIGLEKWILVYIYAFFNELIVFAKKIETAKFCYWKIHVFQYETRRKTFICQLIHINLIHFYSGGSSEDNGLKKIVRYSHTPAWKFGRRRAARSRSSRCIFYNRDVMALIIFKKFDNKQTVLENPEIFVRMKLQSRLFLYNYSAIAPSHPSLFNIQKSVSQPLAKFLTKIHNYQKFSIKWIKLKIVRTARK